MVPTLKSYTLTSIRKFKDKYHALLHTPYFVHTGDLKVEGGVVCLPVYMTPFL